jgi:hypothetical protein
MWRGRTGGGRRIFRILLEVEQSKIFTSAGVLHAISEAEFLDQIQTKVLRVFLLAIQSHLYSFASRILVLQTHATS